MTKTTQTELKAISMADLVGVPSPYSEMEDAFRTWELEEHRRNLAQDDDSAVPRYVEPETTVRGGEHYAAICFQAVA